MLKDMQPIIFLPIGVFTSFRCGIFSGLQATLLGK